MSDEVTSTDLLNQQNTRRSAEVATSKIKKRMEHPYTAAMVPFKGEKKFADCHVIFSDWNEIQNSRPSIVVRRFSL